MPRATAWTLGLLALLACAVGLAWADGPRLARRRAPARAATAAFVARHRLTDLALFTEAPHTRHPGLALPHDALPDDPLPLDRHPSGSLLPPPHATLD
ncbi:hypothetical protein [Mesoterricola sediminis]|uniref:Uncharacterized protein n=1 Tax=Mesoterricola sediminis TaxID=2927980 RepID=A0AA48GW22_9BACT|nr:hypothetical protein [Mesoterricola sediminis]BDU77324.1 hypothetical protein METESE_22820 [Mesoterricola sediminis]